MILQHHDGVNARTSSRACGKRCHERYECVGERVEERHAEVGFPDADSADEGREDEGLD